MLQVEATPMAGFSKSSSENPTARSIERLGARSGPSTTMAENLRRESAFFSFVEFTMDCKFFGRLPSQLGREGEAFHGESGWEACDWRAST